MLMRPALLLGGLILSVGAVLAPQAAQARVFVGVGVGAPFFYPGPYYWGPRYWGPPVVYAPPPVVTYAPPPVTYIAPPTQSYYYCDNPRGYYPSVQSCASGWRQVPAAPPAAR